MGNCECRGDPCSPAEVQDPCEPETFEADPLAKKAKKRSSKGHRSRSNSPKAKSALVRQEEPGRSEEQLPPLARPEELLDTEDTGRSGRIDFSSPEGCGLLDSGSDDDATKGSPAGMEQAWASALGIKKNNVVSNAGVGTLPTPADDVLLSFADFDAFSPTVPPPPLTPLEESPPGEVAVKETTDDGANNLIEQQQQQQKQQQKQQQHTLQPPSALSDGVKADVNTKQQQLEQQPCHVSEEPETQGYSKELGPLLDAEAENMVEPDPERPAEQDACSVGSPATQRATKVLSAAAPVHSPSPGSCLGGCWQLLLPRTKTEPRLPLTA
mmetsp:Transcript_132889/g.265175  ORF Transcript_132889/g.265175 Transcript_132889/m.265175 type:complete len:326 (+) Transcript_132889:121-1098(+)